MLSIETAFATAVGSRPIVMFGTKSIFAIASNIWTASLHTIGSGGGSSTDSYRQVHLILIPLVEMHNSVEFG